jgi:hypothetical protein
MVDGSVLASLKPCGLRGFFFSLVGMEIQASQRAAYSQSAVHHGLDLSAVVSCGNMSLQSKPWCSWPRTPAACGDALAVDPFLNLARDPRRGTLRYLDGSRKSVLTNKLINRASGKARGLTHLRKPQ